MKIKLDNALCVLYTSIYEVINGKMLVLQKEIFTEKNLAEVLFSVLPYGFLGYKKCEKCV